MRITDPDDAPRAINLSLAFVHGPDAHAASCHAAPAASKGGSTPSNFKLTHYRISGQLDEMPIEARFAGAVVKFRLREKLKQGIRPFTDRQQRQPWNQGKAGVRELYPTGILTFEIETRTSFRPPSWIDCFKGQLEDYLPEIAAMILRCRDSVIEAGRIAQVKEALALERQAAREATAAARRRDEVRWTRFVDLSRRSDEAAHLRQFLSRLEAASLPVDMQFGDRSVGEWLSWARNAIERTDPLAGGVEAAFRSLADARP